MATKKKTMSYYLDLNWSYTIETESYRGKQYYIIRVNELPGVCTDCETIEEGMLEIKDAIKSAIRLYIKQKTPIPEPVDKKKFKGNIAYRTTPDRHYRVAQVARRGSSSLSKTLDAIVDAGLASMASS